jgi:hypothetical protein
MTDVTDEQRTIAFFEQWGVSYDAMTAAFHEFFAPDCRWEQRPLAVTTGRSPASSSGATVESSPGASTSTRRRSSAAPSRGS